MLRSRPWVGYILILAIGLTLAGALAVYWLRQYDDARRHYVESSTADARFVSDKVETAFSSIYQNIRTLSFLPSIRTIDRHGTNLSAEAKTTIQQIYNNLASSVAVSEVYILPVDFDPERIDPDSGHHEAPILAFDELIAPVRLSADGTAIADGDATDYSKNPPDQDFVGFPDAAGIPQIEIQEYRRLKQQLAWLSVNRPTFDGIDGINVPMIGGPELITCDNTVFDTTHDDADRSGIIQLVPIYGMDGKLRGGVAAIMRSNAYRALLPDRDFALVNTPYNFATRPAGDGQEAGSASWVKQGKPDPALVYSATLPVATRDTTSNWVVWSGHPNAAFDDSAEVIALRDAASGSFGGLAILLGTTLFVCYLVNRGWRSAASASAVLEQRVLERTAEISELAKAAEAESARRLAGVTETMALNDSLAKVMHAAVAGDFSRRIDLTLEDKGLGALAGSVNSLVATVDRSIAETGSVLAALARTDLTRRVTGAYAGALAQLKDDTNSVADRLSEVVRQLRSASTAVRTATGELLHGADDLAERTSRQAAGVEETAAAVGRLNDTTDDIAARAASADGTARAVARTAAETGAVMDEATAAMHRISTASSKIASIVSLIDDIAFQTNLLALNASVEAARAGDAGRGFAVVAVEVRRLAQSAAAASAQVKQLVELASTEINGGNLLVAKAARSLATMLAGIRENSELVGRIAEATGEQSFTITEISKTIRSIDQMTQHNAALVEETNAAIAQTEAQANALDELVGVFVLAEPAHRISDRRHPRAA